MRYCQTLVQSTSKPYSSNLANARLEAIALYPQAIPISGYEIHQGRTKVLENLQPLFDDLSLGIINSSHSIWGTYLHGLFDNGSWRRTWLNQLRQRRGLKPLPTQVVNYSEQREVFLDAVTDAVTAHLDLNPLLDG